MKGHAVLYIIIIYNPCSNESNKKWKVTVAFISEGYTKPQIQ